MNSLLTLFTNDIQVFGIAKDKATSAGLGAQSQLKIRACIVHMLQLVFL